MSAATDDAQQPAVAEDAGTGAGGESTKGKGKGNNGTTGGGGKEAKVTKKMLKEAEQELFQLLMKKKQLDKSLMDTETAIYDFETSYFENSGADGNIVHGFDGYLNAAGRGERSRAAMRFSEGDRIFSQSSATFKKALEAKITASLLDSDTEDDNDDEEEEEEEVAAKKPSGASRKLQQAGGSTIKHHHQQQRSGTPTSAAARAAAAGATKKIRLSIDGGN
ncbi:Chromatin modification- protein meaf6 [Coemansia thaxteri]|uniref:Chromatin modification-related protein EAF6 n=1 Tax=Coemansia thaxteri TaxID=2663907 RepID=A0A9W8EL85_9FUNG|nr:Chromatin modification- protein meaf6 [Coemansia thaxteri]KAJ2484210.1 Chromatin modification- protein meaf6 [Coemansia sp. RSA 2320]